MIFRIAFLLLIATCGAAVVAAENANHRHVLKGRIIRSLAVEPGDVAHILVGQKSSAPGSALVFQSLDGGKSWRTLNGNKPLAPQATDVQAVAALSKTILLAGTWKHGLYISHDSGAHFARISDFPANDIRDLQVVAGTIYAATARHGIFKSEDKGKSWQALGPSNEFFWSITVAPKRLFANSLGQGVYEWIGGKWDKVFDDDKVYASAASANQIAVAAETGLYLLRDNKSRKFQNGEKFADVVFTKDGHLIAASWSNGIAVLTAKGRLQQRWFKGQSVVHLAIASDDLLVGTWGQGLHIISLSQLYPLALIKATLSDNAKAVQELLATGFDPDTYDVNRNTALIYAARDGHTKIASMLIAAGASPGWIDGEKVTPLILAAHKNYIDIVKLLLAQKVSTIHRDKWGRTALDYARRRGVDDAIYKLLKP